MRWRKLGKIFDPTQHTLPNGCVQFAQSPQALVFDEFVRVYFSTRSVDASNGKYLSHIAFVDMQKSLRDVIRVSDKTVIPLGGLGCFDEHGIFPMSVMRHGVAGFQSRSIPPSAWLSVAMRDSPSNASAMGRCWQHHCMSLVWSAMAL
jgi:hypothetical protein